MRQHARAGALGAIEQAGMELGRVEAAEAGEHHAAMIGVGAGLGALLGAGDRIGLDAELARLPLGRAPQRLELPRRMGALEMAADALKSQAIASSVMKARRRS